MKRSFVKKIMTLSIISISLLEITSVGASAEWRKNTNDSWSYYNNGVPLKNTWFYDKNTNVWCHLDESGIRTTGWFKDTNEKWYYLYDNGKLATNTTTPDGCKVDSNGVWIQNNTTITNTTNTVNNINSNNNYGIVNNGESGNINVNNYYGYNNGNTNNTNSSSNNVVLPITIPSNWIKITNTTYAINSRSPLIYQVKDTFGANKNDIINGLELTLIEKTDLKYESKTYNGYKADCFEYLDTTQKGIEKFYNVTMFNNDKVYNFVMCGDKDNYETDKQSLENVLNTTLKF